jgi:TonB family protein
LGNVQTQIKKKPFSVMKNLLLAFVLLFPFLSVAQNTPIYEVHEVDSVAIPRGGYSYLTTFINTNLQIPYMAKVAKVNGYVSLAGVVDEQGKISQIEVIKGIRPDCDKEAVRVFGLFNAWQAALKGGQKVNQKIFYRIIFKSTENITFVDGMQLEYFDSGYTPTRDSSAYQYVQKTQIDTLTGLAINDITFWEIKRKGKETLLSSFVSKKNKEIEYSLSYPGPLSDTTLKVFNHRYVTQDSKTVGYSIDFFTDGKLFRKKFFMDDKPIYPEIKYFRNGIVREITNYIDSEKESFQKTSWYPNGQILRVIQYENNKLPLTTKMPSSVKSFIVNQWDINGKQILKNGQGEATFETYGNKFKVYTAFGKVVNFQKDGIWQEISEDGVLTYKEFYKNAKLENGVSYSSKGDSVIYTLEEENAEFKGGMQGFADFLQRNLSYPLDAQSSKSQGKVYVQFVVCTDGTLCDYSVLKSAGHPSLDKEAVRVLQKTSGQWKPGVQKGRKVRTRFTVPINFALSR